MRLKRLGTFHFITALAAIGCGSGALAAGPWTDMAKLDLRAIRDVLAANHPGPVDPQNSFYREWLERGFALASERAESAANYGDYGRAVRLYVNGFRDGHINTNFTMSSTALSWPGFLVRRSDADGKVRVAVAREPSGVPIGAELVSCDGKTVEELMAERVDPFTWNRDIPHVRWSALSSLFVLQPVDTTLRLKACTFRTDRELEIALKWTSDPRPLVAEQLAKVNAAPGVLGLRQTGGIWFVALPSFNYSGDAAAPIKALIEEIEAKAPEIRKGTLVFDVRGNGGGNNSWGERVASALWTRELVDRITDSFDWTVDWRVSDANIAHLENIVLQSERDGLPEAAAARRQAADAMKQARARGEKLVRVASPPKKPKGRPPTNPVTGRVFLLTDERCGSACLDFADIVRRLPGVTHIGLPTYADAVYIDNTYTPLPSGLAGLSYSLKVYRNRIRGHNQWYDPHVRWPGGEMTDEALAKWVATLPGGAATGRR